MRFESFSFSSIQIDGATHEHDLVIDRGEMRKRKKKATKQYRNAYCHKLRASFVHTVLVDMACDEDPCRILSAWCSAGGSEGAQLTGEDGGTWRSLAAEGAEHPASATSGKPEVHLPSER